MFKDRTEAGKQLALALEKYRDEQPLVLAIPKGGVEVGYQVANHLKSRFSIVITRKLPFPDNPESGFGAIAEDGSTFIFKDAETWISKHQVETIAREQKQEIQRRIRVLRKGKPLPDIKNQTIIVVDDGIAMGSTMQATILLCKRQQARKIIVAAPVAGENVAQRIGETVDDIVILDKPPFFHAVAQVYEHWYDVPDKEVISIMEKSEQTLP
jgi:predicted phosphoribosyltransferase